jgi:hypothetical protein
METQNLGMAFGTGRENFKYMLPGDTLAGKMVAQGCTVIFLFKKCLRMTPQCFFLIGKRSAAITCPGASVNYLFSLFAVMAVKQITRHPPVTTPPSHFSTLQAFHYSIVRIAGPDLANWADSFRPAGPPKMI